VLGPPKPTSSINTITTLGDNAKAESFVKTLKVEAVI
jgi:hypothetical protein